MTPNKKAFELIGKYQSIEFGSGNSLRNMGITRVKKCVLIAIDEILSIGIWESQEMAESQNTPENCEEFWILVKREVEKCDL
jgi:hypothetical protein